MPSTTPNRGYPYPLLPDPFTPQEDIAALALAIDGQAADYISVTLSTSVVSGVDAFANTSGSNKTGYSVGTQGVYVTRAGVYLAFVNSIWTANGTGYRRVTITANGLDVADSNQLASVASQGSVIGIASLTNGQGFTARLSQTSGATLTHTGKLTLIRLGS